MNSNRPARWLIAFYLISSWIGGTAVCVLTGCEQKEKVIEVDTPNSEVEVERDKNTGDVEVEVEKK
jgi:hypothetical protein